MTTDTKVADLPELPEPDWKARDGVSEGVYSAAQVRDFGMACYQAALARQEADTAAPVGQVALLDMFSKLKTSGGCIVSSGDCGTMEIVDAQARGDFTADADGFGFVLRPHAWLQKHSRFASGANDSCEQQDAAPPAAQAVDLEQLHKLADAMDADSVDKSCCASAWRSACSHYGYALRHILIDQQAGKGVDRA